MSFAELFDEFEEPLHRYAMELLGILPASLRDLWYRRYVDGMNAAEIARELGIPHATVRSRLHAARRRLRGQIERYL